MDTRFWTKVDKDGHGGCWVYGGRRNRSGYGEVFRGGRTLAAHRFSWELVNGPIPPGMLVCHHCDNRPCVNPDHLFVGTHKDNMHDMWQKGRQGQMPTGVPSLGEDHGCAILTEAAVVAMRAAHADGIGTRTLSERHGVSQSTVRAVIRGTTWKHVSGALPPHPVVRVSNIEDAYNARARGDSWVSIAATFGWRNGSVAQSTICEWAKKRGLPVRKRGDQ